MRWFGRRPWAPICYDTPHADTPVGRPCAWCEEPIEAEDDGVLIPHLAEVVTEEPWHPECQLRSIVGGLNHQLGRCTCCGGSLTPDPEGLTRREAAGLAARHFKKGAPQ